MRIAVGADERCDIDVLAADVFHHVAEDRECGDHRDRPVGLRGGWSGEGQGEDGGGDVQKGSAGGHENAPSGFEVTAPQGPRGKTADRPKDQRDPVGETGDEDDRRTGGQAEMVGEKKAAHA